MVAVQSVDEDRGHRERRRKITGLQNVKDRLAMEHRKKEELMKRRLAALKKAKMTKKEVRAPAAGRNIVGKPVEAKDNSKASPAKRKVVPHIAAYLRHLKDAKVVKTEHVREQKHRSLPAELSAKLKKTHAEIELKRKELKKIQRMSVDDKNLREGHAAKRNENKHEHAKKAKKVTKGHEKKLRESKKAYLELKKAKELKELKHKKEKKPRKLNAAIVEKRNDYKNNFIGSK